MTPAIRVHSLADARHALGAARELARPVMLVSGPGAAWYAGAGWWRALLDHADAEFPDVEFDSVLDCSGAPGYALASLREGVPCIAFSGHADAAVRLKAIAAQLGARVLDALPPALELDGLRDPAIACRVWLREEPVLG